MPTATELRPRPGSTSSGDFRDNKVILDSEVEVTTNSADQDPSRMKSFGFIAARPSEFLIVYRRGRLREEVSGQGARCFKLPWDTVAIIPTTLKEVMFQANQITVDNVDVRLRGMVLYRIADPLRIYTLLNFTNRQASEAKLARMLADMCRSTAKWLVANMGVEECVRRRKEEIARAMRDEVSSVVSSDGPEGWGVEIITIDIQDVYIQDEELFRSMQARFKAEKTREAQLVQLQIEQEVTTRRLAAEQALQKERHEVALERARIDAQMRARQIELNLEQEALEQDVARRRIEAERALAQTRHEAERDRARLAADLAMADLELRRKQEEEAVKLERARMEEAEAAQRYRAEQSEARLKLQADGKLERARVAVERMRLANDESARGLRERLEAESAAGPASLERLFLQEALPEVAKTLARSMENLRYSVVHWGGQDGQAPNPVQLALGQALDLLQQRLDPQRASAPRPKPPAA